MPLWFPSNEKDFIPKYICMKTFHIPLNKVYMHIFNFTSGQKYFLNHKRYMPVVIFKYFLCKLCLFMQVHILLLYQKVCFSNKTKPHYFVKLLRKPNPIFDM
jgi:hypothetical protein